MGDRPLKCDWVQKTIDPNIANYPFEYKCLTREDGKTCSDPCLDTSILPDFKDQQFEFTGKKNMVVKAVEKKVKNAKTGKEKTIKVNERLIADKEIRPSFYSYGFGFRPTSEIPTLFNPMDPTMVALPPAWIKTPKNPNGYYKEGDWIKITNKDNKKYIYVRVFDTMNDRFNAPIKAPGEAKAHYHVDLSPAAMKALCSNGYQNFGNISVDIQKVKPVEDQALDRGIFLVLPEQHVYEAPVGNEVKYEGIIKEFQKFTEFVNGYLMVNNESWRGFARMEIVIRTDDGNKLRIQISGVKAEDKLFYEQLFEAYKEQNPGIDYKPYGDERTHSKWVPKSSAKLLPKCDAGSCDSLVGFKHLQNSAKKFAAKASDVLTAKTEEPKVVLDYYGLANSDLFGLPTVYLSDLVDGYKMRREADSLQAEIVKDFSDQLPEGAVVGVINHNSDRRFYVAVTVFTDTAYDAVSRIFAEKIRKFDPPAVKISNNE